MPQTYVYVFMYLEYFQATLYKLQKKTFMHKLICINHILIITKIILKNVDGRKNMSKWSLHN